MAICVDLHALVRSIDHRFQKSILKSHCSFGLSLSEPSLITYKAWRLSARVRSAVALVLLLIGVIVSEGSRVSRGSRRVSIFVPSVDVHVHAVQWKATRTAQNRVLSEPASRAADRDLFAGDLHVHVQFARRNE